MSFSRTVYLFPSFKTDFCKYIIVAMFESDNFKVSALQRGGIRSYCFFFQGLSSVGQELHLELKSGESTRED